jgi:hypothetical protein
MNGDKIDAGKVMHCHFRTIQDPALCHMCPISLVFIHALRHGMLDGGNNIQHVLDLAANRSDGRIMWKYPQRPVLCAYHKGAGNKLNLDKQAPAE